MSETAGTASTAGGGLRSAGPTLLAGLAGLSFLATFDWAVSRVFLLNFSTAGPNATVLLLFAFVTGWSVGVVALVSPPARVLYPGTTGLAALGILASAVAPPAAAGLAAALALTALSPLLVALASELRSGVAVGAAAGLLAGHALRAWRDTAALFATTAGRAALVAVAVAALALAAALVRADAVAVPDRWGSVSAVPLFAFLFAQAAFLGHPHVVARWTLRPYVPALAASTLGLAVGVGWLSLRGPPSGPGLAGAGLAYLLSLSALVFAPTGGPFDPVVLALFPAQATAVALLGSGSRAIGPRSTRRAVAGLVGGQLVLVLLVACYVLAVNAAFLPAAVRSVLSGRATGLLFALVNVLPVATGVVAGAARAEPGPAGVDPRRRATLSAAGLGIAGLAGGALPLGASPGDGGDAPYRVLTLNVHQYFADGPRGGFNLEAVGRAVAATDADLVGLQESDGTRVSSAGNDGVRWLADRLGYHAVFGAPGRAGTVGVALLSRWPVLDTSVVYLPVGRSFPRPTLVATVDAPDGPLPVLVTHFEVDKPGDRQADQARRVVDLATDADRAVVLGDFNVPADDEEEAYRILKSGLTDAWTAAGHPEAGGYTWPAGDPERRIDYVWLHGDWRVGAAELVGTPAVSDHLGVLATVDPGGES